MLKSLKEFEKELEKYLEERPDIEMNKKELIILQALSHTLLKHYHSQAISQKHYPKNLFSTPRHK